MTTTGKVIRCAIYTRVSTDAGLDQEFNSLDAQYDAASALDDFPAIHEYRNGYSRTFVNSKISE